MRRAAEGAGGEEVGCIDGHQGQEEGRRVEGATGEGGGGHDASIVLLCRSTSSNNQPTLSDIVRHEPGSSVPLGR